MQRIKFIFITVCLSLFMVSCATNGKLTDVLEKSSTITRRLGDHRTSAVLGAAASISKASEDITPENEYYIGRSVAATILTSYKPYNNPEKELYVNEIAQTIVRVSPRPDIYNGYHVKILDTQEMNAFATSGGHIFITRGLVEAVKNEEALAAAIAHEISHIQLEHATKVIKSGRYTEAATKSLTAAIAVRSDDDDVAKVASKMQDCVSETVSELVTKGYSKNQEFDADKKAVELMNYAGYNPDGMISLLETLKEVNGKKAGGLFKTHPAPKERIKNVQKEMKKMDKKPDTSKFRTERFNSLAL